MINLVNWQQEEPTDCGGERQLSMDGTSRVSREAQARICERLGVRFPGATRPATKHGLINTWCFSGRFSFKPESTVRFALYLAGLAPAKFLEVPYGRHPMQNVRHRNLADEENI